jgi:hypothetical protein
MVLFTGFTLSNRGPLQAKVAKGTHVPKLCLGSIVLALSRLMSTRAFDIPLHAEAFTSESPWCPEPAGLLRGVVLRAPTPLHRRTTFCSQVQVVSQAFCRGLRIADAYDCSSSIIHVGERPHLQNCTSLASWACAQSAHEIQHR